MADATTGKPCRCGAVENWLRMLDHPVRFDPRFNEYSIVDAAGAWFLMQYCPVCGDKLPPSRRGDFFMEIDPAESVEACRLVKGIRTGKKILRKLSQPEHVFDWVEDPHRPTPPDAIRWAKQFTYTSRFRTLDLIVQMDTNDVVVGVSWSPKAKP